MKISVIAGVWLLAVLAGSLLMAQYSQTAGAAGSPPSQWPETSQMPHSPGQPTLVMFLHPRCPCSRATLVELEQLVAHCRGLFHAQVCFIRPENRADEWVKTDLWDAASAIPGVQVHVDHDGKEALSFQAATSGQTLLYDAGGTLVFQGGITLARGHAGDNPGRDAIEVFLKQKNTLSASAPVFGCALAREKDQTECTTCQP